MINDLFSLILHVGIPLTLWVRTPLRWGVLDTTLCDKVCQLFAAGQWFFSWYSGFLHQ